MEARALFETWFDRLWTQRDASAIRELRADSAVSAGLTARPISNADFEVFHARVMEKFTETKVVIERFLQEGDRVALSVRFTGTTRRGQRMMMCGMGFARVEDGKIIEGENLWDVAGFLAQIGAKAAPSARTLDEAIGLVR